MKKFIRNKLHIAGVLFFLLNNHSNFFSKAKYSQQKSKLQPKIFHNNKIYYNYFKNKKKKFFNNNAPDKDQSQNSNTTDEDQPQNSSTTDQIISVTAGFGTVGLILLVAYQYKYKKKPQNVSLSSQIPNQTPILQTKDGNIVTGELNNKPWPKIIKDEIQLIHLKLDTGTNEEKVEEYLSILQKIIEYTEIIKYTNSQENIIAMKTYQINFNSLLIKDPIILNQVNNLNDDNQRNIDSHVLNIIDFFKIFSIEIQQKKTTIKKELSKKIFDFFLSNKNKIIEFLNLPENTKEFSYIHFYTSYGRARVTFDLKIRMIIMFYNLIDENNLTQKQREIVEEYMTTCQKLGFNNNEDIIQRIDIQNLTTFKKFFL